MLIALEGELGLFENSKLELIFPEHFSSVVPLFS